MSVFPHSRLFLLPSRSIALVISGPHIQIINSTTGSVLSSTASLPGDERDAVVKSGPVRCAVVDKSETYLATTGDDKQLKIWEIDGLKLLNARELPKKPTGILFTNDAQTIVVSDKFGDVFSYPFYPAPLPEKQKRERDSLTSHDNPSGGQLILGHASLLTSVLLTPDEKYIITSDRDEHIRVSWWPQGYTIEMYCMGHKKYVSAIHIPSFASSELISGGGDPMLKIWDWMSGSVKHEIRVLETVETFIRVKIPKRRQEGGAGDDVPQRSGKRGKGRKGKGKRKLEDAHNGDSEPQNQDPELDAANPVDVTEEPVAQEEQTVFVIHRIDTVDSEQGRHIIFSAVGTTALFSCPYPDQDLVENVHAFGFGKPILDFVVGQDNHIWVLLDAQWSSGLPETSSKMVRVVKLFNGELREVEHPIHDALTDKLNSQCLLPATKTELQELNLYADLSSMPKNMDVDHNPMDRDEPELDLNPEGEEVKQLGKRQLGRLRSKKALLAKVQASDTVPARGSPVVEQDLPEAQRTKSEHGDGESMLVDP